MLHMSEKPVVNALNIRAEVIKSIARWRALGPLKVVAF